LQVLRDAGVALSAASKSEYTYDEGEQGQPAFRWVRRDDSLRVSIVDSTLSDGRADPAWQNVECKYEDFRAEIERFEAAFRAALLLEAPIAGAAWVKNHLRDAAQQIARADA
jgi:hypothetical protein